MKHIYSIFNVSFVPTGDQYYQYEFKHQPSHEECVRMTKSAPSVAFTRYTNLYCDLDNVFALLFQGSKSVCICCLSKDFSKCLVCWIIPCPSSARASQRAAFHFQRLDRHQTSHRCSNGWPTVRQPWSLTVSSHQPEQGQKQTEKEDQGSRSKSEPLAVLGRLWIGLWGKVCSLPRFVKRTFGQ